MIDFNKPVQTRSGLKVRILAIDIPDDTYTIAAIVFGPEEGSASVQSYMADGRYLTHEECSDDLIQAPEEVIRYVNTYRRYDGDIYYPPNQFLTQKEAEEKSSHNSLAYQYIGVSKITLL